MSVIAEASAQDGRTAGIQPVAAVPADAAPRQEAPPGAPKPDERIAKMSALRRLLHQPELGSVAGLLIVTLFFLFTASGQMFSAAGIMTLMLPSAQLGILAIAAALLMIGGEFDLSIGSQVAFSGLVFGVLLVNLHWPLLPAILGTMVVAGAIGALNGWIVLRTRLPSFIVTLAFLFILRGGALVGLKLATGGSTQLAGFNDATAGALLLPLFSGNALGGLFGWMAHLGWLPLLPDGTLAVPGVPVAIIWFIGFTALATWVLRYARVGNWIFASGGDANAARNSGVPVAAVKIGLFILTACAGSWVAILTTLQTGSTDAMRGFQDEFHAIIAAVIGGCLLTGGYGSAVGAFFGAIIYGMVSIGLSYTNFDSDSFQIFLGAMLLFAVLFNNFIRKRATGER